MKTTKEKLDSNFYVADPRFWKIYENSVRWSIACPPRIGERVIEITSKEIGKHGRKFVLGGGRVTSVKLLTEDDEETKNEEELVEVLMEHAPKPLLLELMDGSEIQGSQDEIHILIMHRSTDAHILSAFFTYYQPNKISDTIIAA